ncbi:MAG TPA: NAD-dependent epimerase/dehydratase family protein [Solirubrobacteraceae bacterium]|jgi:UDP-glucose 4-epimerase|nr:NAD-dependent epimerase/dehydratase family protein [Solirubrobacteraceae bacterium]
MQLDGSNVLVTGGGGFVGAPSVRALIEEGARVRVLDVAAPPSLAELDCEVRIADIADADSIAGACDGIDAVLHLAVLPLNMANTEHEVAFQTNVRGSFNVFRAAGEAGVKRIVYSSASSAYGPTSSVPIREDHPLRPNAFYPATKAAAEMLLRGLAGAYGYSSAILRYMNVYGPGQRAGVVPAVARRMLAGERPQLSGDGSQGFDFVHIEDCARANLCALRSEVNGEDFNVGHGTSATLNELVALFGELTGDPLEPTYDGPVSSVPARVGDVTKARDLIGFSATIALRDGLQTVLDELRSSEAAEVT